MASDPRIKAYYERQLRVEGWRDTQVWNMRGELLFSLRDRGRRTPGVAMVCA